MTTPPKNQLGNIEHVVVLMLENRSFDNILGYLYDPGNPPPFNKKPPANFEGVSGKNLSNPGPNNTTVNVGKGDVLTDPNPDPGEPYEDVYSQLYNVPAPRRSATCRRTRRSRPRCRASSITTSRSRTSRTRT